MPSESARMTTAAAARLRINDPNSRPRSVKVIALDPPSELVVQRLARGTWQGAAFFTSVSFDGAPRGNDRWSMKSWLGDLAGRTNDLLDEVASADLVVMVAAAVTDAAAAAVIAEACGARKVATTALVIGGNAGGDEALSRTLANLRPHAAMLVIAEHDDYVEAMLTALRA